MVTESACDIVQLSLPVLQLLRSNYMFGQLAVSVLDPGADSIPSAVCR